MGGEISIARVIPGSASVWEWHDISIEEWRAVLRNVDGVRPSEQPLVGRNPVTSEEIAIPHDPDCGEIYDEETDSWIPLLTWADGSIYFYPPPEEEAFFRSPVMKRVHEVARALRATVIDGRSGTIEG